MLMCYGLQPSFCLVEFLTGTEAQIHAPPMQLSMLTMKSPVPYTAARVTESWLANWEGHASFHYHPWTPPALVNKIGGSRRVKVTLCKNVLGRGRERVL